MLDHLNPQTKVALSGRSSRPRGVAWCAESSSAEKPKHGSWLNIAEKEAR